MLRQAFVEQTRSVHLVSAQDGSNYPRNNSPANVLISFPGRSRSRSSNQFTRSGRLSNRYFINSIADIAN